jgi:hypothetical protein
LPPITIVIDASSAGSRRNGSRSSTRALPLVGWSRPARILSVVVLPAPLGPRKPTRSPRAIVNETPSTALTVV